MNLARTMLIAAAAYGLVASAAGQMIPPVPDKTPPTEPYEPPPPPPPPPEQPERPKPEPPPPLPSIVELDGGGKIVPLTTTKPMAALLAFDWNDEQRAKIDAAIDAYWADVDRAVIDHIDRVMIIREKSQVLEEISGIGKMMELSQTYRDLPALDLLESARKAGAITPVDKRWIEQVIKAYDDAVKGELAERYTNDDAMLLIDIVGRQTFTEKTRDLLASLNRQVADAAPRMGELVAQIDLDQDQRARADAILRTRMAPEAIAWKIFEEVLDDEQRQALLKAASPELYADQQESEPTSGDGHEGHDH